jgi:polysaccharide deacetylase family protein (PEP-CTERM system associated)
MFSIGAEQAWAYDILLEEGFQYDSSVYPIFHDRYGDPYAPRFPYVIAHPASQSLIEFPIGTVRFCGVNLPVGGGHFRLAPVDWIQRCIQRVNKYEGQPVMFYFHPWELDPDQPRPTMPLHHRFRHYVGLRQEADKLWRLLWSCRFTTTQAVLNLFSPTNLAVPDNAKPTVDYQ